MKKIVLLIAVSFIAISASAQGEINIKRVVTAIQDISPKPFLRHKKEKFGYEYVGKRRLDGTVATKELRQQPLNAVENFSNMPYYGYIDFNNTEKFGVKPTGFDANKKFQSSKDNYIFIPFIVNAGTQYNEDMIASCDKTTGIVADVLFATKYGTYFTGDPKETLFLFTKWSINQQGEITVYELQLTTNDKVYFKTCPPTIKLKRVDTTYQIDDNGKFKVIKVKEYLPKDYSRAELAESGKNIWEGSEIPL